MFPKSSRFALTIALCLVPISIGHAEVKNPAFYDIPPQKLPENNGWELLLQAAKARQYTARYSTEPNADLALLREQVAINGAAYDLAQKALQRPIARPRENMSVAMPHHASLRELARALGYKAFVEAADEKWQASADTSLDIVQMGASLTNGSNIIGALTARSIEWVGFKSLEKSAAQLSGESLKKVAQRMEKCDALRARFPAILTEEKWQQLAMEQKMMAGAEWKDFRKKPLGSSMQKGLNWSAATTLSVAALSDKQILQNLHAGFEAHIEQWKGSYVAYQKWVNAQKTPTPDAYTSLILSPVGRFAWSFLAHSAEARLRYTSLALRAYRAEKGAYPENLQQLTPAFLQAVPRDPFDSSRPLTYRRDGDAFVLYSIGPDGVDDKGKPFADATDKTRFYRGEADSKGDMLAPA